MNIDNNSSILSRSFIRLLLVTRVSVAQCSRIETELNLITLVINNSL